MGLDSIEILMKVENTFDIKIPNREADKILTIGDFHDAVWRQLSGRYGDKCKCQALFYKLRKAFKENFNFPPDQFLLDTSPEEIFSKTNRRKIYTEFATTINLQLPTLILTPSWTTILNTFGLTTIVGGLVISLILINFFDYSKWSLLIPLSGIFLTILFSNFLQPMRTKIPYQTTWTFTEHILALNYSTFLADEGTNRKEMELVINQVIADMAGLDMEEITPEKKIGDDLGIDLNNGLLCRLWRQQINARRRLLA